MVVSPPTGSAGARGRASEKVHSARPKVPLRRRAPMRASSALPARPARRAPAHSCSVGDMVTVARSVRPAGSARTRKSWPSFAAPVAVSCAVDWRPVSGGAPDHPARGGSFRPSSAAGLGRPSSAAAGHSRSPSAAGKT